MSAPVLTWLFIVQGKLQAAFLTQQFSPCTNPHFTRKRQVASAQLKHQYKDPNTQPSEPILFPKLRICFADFPYLLCSTNQRLLTLETWCGYGYDQGCKWRSEFGFSRTVGSTPDTSEDKVLYPERNPSSRQSVFRVATGKKEKTTLSKTPPCITKVVHVTIKYPLPGWKILIPFPFKECSKASIHRITLPFRAD